MPLYTFYCKECEKVFEAQIMLKDYEKIVPCKYCGQPLKRVITGVRFKVN
jgi:putative FmdB family regulatory protein